MTEHPAVNGDADADADADSDGADFLVWQRNFGQTVLAQPALAQIPEPTSLTASALLLGGVAFSKGDAVANVP